MTQVLDNRALDVPRLYIPPGSPLAFVRFASAVVTVSLSSSELLMSYTPVGSRSPYSRLI